MKKTRIFAYAKTKTQISFAATAKLISAFVFATQIVQSLYFLITKFQASSHLMRLYSPVSIGPGRKPHRQVFSQRGSINSKDKTAIFKNGLIINQCKHLTKSKQVIKRLSLFLNWNDTSIKI